MNCPYCNEEIEKLGVGFGDMPMEYRCKNPDCAKKYGDASIKVWEDLVKTKQALDLAIDWLEQVATPAKCDDDLCREFTKRKLAEIKQITETKDVK